MTLLDLTALSVPGFAGLWLTSAITAARLRRQRDRARADFAAVERLLVAATAERLTPSPAGREPGEDELEIPF